ncbi:MAG: protein kinase domain-containing protein [Bradymonadia bacterium]
MRHPPPPNVPGVDLFDVLGAGSSGTVYGGVFTGGRGDHPVAVKVVPGRPDDPARRAERALQEAHFCFSLDHPHVVRVYDWGQLADRSIYIIMERLSGQALGDVLSAEGPLSPSATLAIGRQLARGLAAIHRRGACHRDVKVDNVFLCDNGILPEQVKLLDLGLAALSKDDPQRRVHTAQGLIFGTPGYMSPEQCLGEDIEAPSDVFSWGATLYCCLTGRPPFTGRTPRAVLLATANATEAPALPDTVPAGLARVIRAALSPKPSDRPQTAEALVEALEKVHLEGAGKGAFEHTTLVFGGRTIQVGDLHLPSLGDLADHQRFRSHVVLTVARIFKPGYIPTELTAQLQEVDRLDAERRSQLQARDETRREADEAARTLLSRTRRLSRAIDGVTTAYEQARARYVDLSTALMEVSTELGDADQAYIRAYREIEQLQRQESARASARAEPVALEGLFGASVEAILTDMRASSDARAKALAQQRAVRQNLLEVHQQVHDLRHQLLELQRSNLAVEAEQETRLAALEAAARAADDEALHLERAVEHAFLELGIALQLAMMAP